LFAFTAFIKLGLDKKDSFSFHLFRTLHLMFLFRRIDLLLILSPFYCLPQYNLQHSNNNNNHQHHHHQKQFDNVPVYSNKDADSGLCQSLPC
jgi:hypothetical protein